MASVDRIVAVGLLTQNEFDVLGASLKRLYPVGDAAGFEELIRALDEEVSPSAASTASAPPAISLGNRIRNLLR